jgi:hypothetical protein
MLCWLKRTLARPSLQREHCLQMALHSGKATERTRKEQEWVSASPYITVTSSWAYHHESNTKQADRDFMRLNKMSVKEKMTDSKVRPSSFRNKLILGNRTMRDLGREP